MRVPRPVLLAAATMLAAACGFPELAYDAGAGAEDAPSGADGPSADGTVDAPHGDAGGDAADATVDQGVDSGGGGDATTADGPAGEDAADAGDAPATGDTGTPPDAGAGDGSDASPEAGTDAAPEAAADGGDGAAGDASDAAPDAPPNCDEDDDTFHADGGTCGGNDCCDVDDAGYPGQSAYFTKPNKCGSFDYNCNGKEDPQYATSISCGGTGALGCTGGPGYTTDPGCGNSGTFYQCVPNGALACKPGSPVAQVQGCH